MKDLTIRMRLDRSQAAQATKEHIADAARMESATKESVAGQVNAIGAGAKASTGIIGDAARKNVAATRTVGKAATEAGDAINAAGRRGAGGMLEMSAAVGLVENGLSKLVGVARAVRDTIQEAARIGREMQRQFTDERERVAELAAVMGKDADNKFTLENANFNKEVGMKPAEGLDFRLGYQNTGAQYAGKTIPQEEFEEFEQQAAKMATARKLNPGVAGDFFGSVLGFKSFTKFGDKASEEALATGNASIEVLKRGKGDNAILVKQLAELNSSLLNEDSLKGAITDPNISAMLISTAAEKNQGEAAGMTQAALRGLRDFNGDAKPLLDKAGVVPSMNPIESLRKIQPVVEAEAKEKGLNVDDVLKTYFKDHLTSSGIGVFLNKGVSGGIFHDREDLLAGKIPGIPAVSGTGPAMDVLKKFDDSERGQLRKADAAKEEATLDRGAKTSRMEILRQQAIGELTKEEKIDTTASMLMDNLVWKPLTGFTIDPREMSIEGRMGEIVGRRGKAAGVDIQPGPLMGYHTAEGMNENFGRAMDRISAAGGDPMKDLGAKLDANAKALEANTKEMEAQRRKPPENKPAGPPVAPGWRWPQPLRP